MDIKLGGSIDGIETARVINDIYGSFIIFVSAHSDTETKERAMSTNPAGFINKPIAEFELVRMLSKVFPK